MSSAIPETLISDYLDEQLDAEQFEVLRQWILADDQHAQIFLRRAAMHRLAREHFVAAELVAMMGADDADSLDELDLGFDGAIDADAVIAAVEADQRHHEQRAAEAASRQKQQAMSAERSWEAIAGRATIDEPPVRHIVIPRWLAYGSGAALAASVLLMIYTLFGVGRGAEAPRQPQPGPTDNVAVAPTSTSIGRITGTVAAAWADSAVMLRMGDALPAAPLQLTQGVVELTFDQGAKVLIEAPAQFEPRSADRLVLTAGRITGEVPPHANGFTVNTPSATVIDLGTAFGITVEEDASAATEVHVFDGQVALATPAGDGRPSAERRILDAGEAGRVDDAGLRTIAFAGRDFLRSVPGRYEWLVRQADPLFHWRFSSAVDTGVITQQGRRGDDGILPGNVTIARESLYDGTFSETVQFQSEHSGIAGGMLGNWRHTADFTIEAWIKPMPDRMGNYRIISNRDVAGGFTFGIAGIDNTVNAPHMAVMFSFFTVRDYASAEPVEANRWSHVVVTVDADGFPRFYINGRESGTLIRYGGTAYREVGPADSNGPGRPSRQPLFIANNPPPVEDRQTFPEPDAAYYGSLEHIVIYDRVLTHSEVAAHYRAGLGSDADAIPIHSHAK